MAKILPRLAGYEVAVSPTDPAADPAAYIAAKSLWVRTSSFPPSLYVRNQDNTAWVPNGSPYVPSLLLANESLFVPARTQVLFSEEIDLEDGAEIDVDGVLVEV